MKITKGAANELIVNETITSIEECSQLRSSIQNLVDTGSTAITLRIVDSFAMPSAIIGYLMKLVKKENVRLSIKTGDMRLYELLDELNLTTTFNVSKDSFVK